MWSDALQSGRRQTQRQVRDRQVMCSFRCIEWCLCDLWPFQQLLCGHLSCFSVSVLFPVLRRAVWRLFLALLLLLLFVTVLVFLLLLKRWHESERTLNIRELWWRACTAIYKLRLTDCCTFLSLCLSCFLFLRFFSLLLLLGVSSSLGEQREVAPPLAEEGTTGGIKRWNILKVTHSSC